MLARLFQPGLSVAFSAVAASLALAGALALSRAGDYLRAASWATGQLAREMQKRAKRAAPLDPLSARGDGRSWVLQESHLLREDKLRFIGVLVRPDEDESAGWPVALTVVRRDARFLVEDLHWPKGPPP